MHEFPEPTSYRLHQDLYLLQLPFSATPPAKIWVLPQLIELRNIIQTSFKNCRRKTIRKSSLGRGREVDLPLPKAVESCSLEGIYPKWPNFPKIVLWRPKGVKSGKPKQNNKHTAPYWLCLRITQPLLPAKCTLPRRGRKPSPASCAPRRTPTHLPRPGSVSRRLPVAALANATTPLLRSPPKSNHIQASECRSPRSERARGSNALAPRWLHGLPPSSLKLACVSPVQWHPGRGGAERRGQGQGQGQGGRSGKGESERGRAKARRGSGPAPGPGWSHVQIKFRLLSRPPEPFLLARREARLHAAQVRRASHWAIPAVSHQEGDMTDTKLLRHSLDSQLP